MGKGPFVRVDIGKGNLIQLHESEVDEYIAAHPGTQRVVPVAPPSEPEAPADPPAPPSEPPPAGESHAKAPAKTKAKTE